MDIHVKKLTATFAVDYGIISYVSFALLSKLMDIRGNSC